MYRYGRWRSPILDNIMKEQISLNIGQFMQPMKDSLGLELPGACKFPCTCGYCYIVQTGCSILECLKEHQCYLRLRQEEKSALASHWWSTATLY